MRRSVHLVWCAAAVLGAAAASAPAHDAPPVASAHGKTTVTLHDVFGLHTLQVQRDVWEARLAADGSVTGSFDYRDDEDGAIFTLSGRVTCLALRGNQAWVGGVVDASNDPA